MTAWNCYDSRPHMVEALKLATVRALSDGLATRGRASWAVSGGSTPAPLFEAMAEADLDWSKVDIALVDERWVDADHARSNEAMVKQILMQGPVAAARFVGMKTPHRHAGEAVATVNASYALLAQPFDSILLGMGPDGHTASLFPGADGLEDALDIAGARTCAALTAIRSEVTGDEVERMSLTAAAIKKARHVALMLTGQDKKEVLQRALTTDRHLPVARLADSVAIDIYWAP